MRLRKLLDIFLLMHGGIFKLGSEKQMILSIFENPEYTRNILFSSCSLFLVFSFPRVFFSSCFLFLMFSFPRVLFSSYSLFLVFSFPHVFFFSCSLFPVFSFPRVLCFRVFVCFNHLGMHHFHSF